MQISIYTLQIIQNDFNLKAIKYIYIEKMNFFNLPRELITMIFEMDNTYRNKFNLCMNELILLKIKKRQKLLKMDILRDIDILGKLPEYHREYPTSELTASDFDVNFIMPNDEILDIEYWVDDYMIRNHL